MTTSPTVARNAGSPGRAALDCTSTTSDAGGSKPARVRIVSARAEPSCDCSAFVSIRVPTVCPATRAIATSASHPKVAVFQ